MAQPSGAAFIVLTIGFLVLTIGQVAAAASQVVERLAERSLAYAGPSPEIDILAAVPCSLSLLSEIGNPLVALGLPSDGPLAALVAISLTAVAYVALIRLLVVGPGVLSWREMGVVGPSRETLSELLWGFVLALPVFTATGFLALMLSQVLPIPQSTLPPAGDVRGLLLNLLTAGVVAAVAEEIFFRGFVTTAWLRSHGRTVALVRGSLLFAIAHVITLGGESAGSALLLATFAFAIRVPVSLALGWLFLSRRTVWASIGLHAGFNALPLLIVAASGA
jgi:membrane protease YdiL (CAAX protease family)